MIISIITALDNNNLIGKKNGLPWYLPADLKHFKEKTLGKPVVMGKTTYESIGKLLPERTNIILSRDANFKVSGARVVKSVEEALEVAKGFPEVMIIGGASIYKQFLPLAQKLYLTRVYNDFEGDIYFPEFNLDEWQETERLDYKAHDKNLYDYSFLTFSRK
ncbi:MAG: dihydrofolate reductase [Candidatus Colwellbacteria bacterium RIFCSPHIGHO2_02_FULL_43_15]|uniref:Dihydrofolate reductase n=2 Tax=Candidatus Colwelliibacteriota TaxID=1817904 RepID=A0A1G1Z2D1_9BACT|nr:MAG: dihydrofolate reductase [Candidatus Colwellbacteria bacterium RIFCSPHIGHO2_02_FULL_43_15]OGY61814.1 MAG: dihydrofolate reductase [Candidatus Colwellbacteria bacterium RIFCSPLOWO2_12_FULL_43_11]